MSQNGRNPVRFVGKGPKGFPAVCSTLPCADCRTWRRHRGEWNSRPARTVRRARLLANANLRSRDAKKRIWRRTPDSKSRAALNAVKHGLKST
jgi:hypothetical protein